MMAGAEDAALRVLFVTHSYPRAPGDAAGSFLLRLAQALGAEGIEVRVVAPSGPGLAREEVLGGVPVARFRYAPRAWETLAYTGNMVSDVRGSLKGKVALAGFLARGTRAVTRARLAWQPALVHAHWWFPAGVMAARASGLLPLVTTLHGTDVRLAAASRRAQPFCRRVLERSRIVTTVSSWLAGTVRGFAPQADPRVEPMPAATELFAPGGERSGDRLLFVGRLNEQKGITHLLEALAQLPAHVTLDAVGDGTVESRGALEAQTEKLGLRSRVRWHGAVLQPALAALYQAAAVVVVPSVGEGLGLVAVEAHLCGAPVVAFESGGITDVVRHDVTGLLSPPGEPLALASAVGRVLADPGLGQRLGTAGRASALARFAPDAVARRYAAIYREAARRG